MSDLAKLVPVSVVEGTNIEKGVGISIGLDEDIYRANKAWNQSGSTMILRNPAKWKWLASQSHSGTEFTRFGTLVHLALLETERFKDEVVQAPDFLSLLKKEYKSPKATKEYKELEFTFSEKHKGKEIVSFEDGERLAGIIQSVANKPSLTQLLSIEGYNELSCFWLDQATGIRCKSRIDRFVPSMNACVDIKTTAKSAAQVDYGKNIFERGYDIQAAHYLRGCQTLGLKKVKHFIHLVIETTPPFSCAAYRLSDFDIKLGNQKLDQIMKVYKACSEADFWPGYPDEIKEVSQPNYGEERAERLVRASETALNDWRFS